MNIIVRRGDRVLWWCPGCDDVHMVPVTPDNPDGWGFDGNLDHPTLTPSVFVNPPHLTKLGSGTPPGPACHSFVRAGRIEFLGDSEHELAGQTVPMGPVPAYLIPDDDIESETVPR